MGAHREGRPAFRVAISGYYGFRNSGDEAVLRSILTALREEGRDAGVEVEPVVLSGDPAWTEAAHGVPAAHRMRPAEVLRTLRGCDALVSGGGSLLQDATSAKTIPYYTGIVGLARLLGKPVFVYAQGVGPVKRAWLRPLVRAAMNASRIVTVRDEESAALLARLGVARGRIGAHPGRWIVAAGRATHEASLCVAPFVEKALHVDDQVLDDRHVGQRRELQPPVGAHARDVGAASPTRHAVDRHGARSAHSDTACVAV